MPKIIPIPEPVPYAGLMSIHVNAEGLEKLVSEYTHYSNLVLNAEGVPSNTVPHTIKRLGWLGIGAEHAKIEETLQPHEGLRVVTRSELAAMAVNSTAAQSTWTALSRAIENHPECRLQLGIESGQFQISGDFGFGLEWLSVNRPNTLTGSMLANNVLTARADELGVNFQEYSKVANSGL